MRVTLPVVIGNIKRLTAIKIVNEMTLASRNLEPKLLQMISEEIRIPYYILLFIPKAIKFLYKFGLIQTINGTPSGMEGCSCLSCT